MPLRCFCVSKVPSSLIFICVPSSRNPVAMSLGFFHTWPVLISSCYNTFTWFLLSNAFASLLSVTLIELWSDDLFLLCSLQGSSYQHFAFWYFRSHLLHLIGSDYFQGAAFLTGIAFGTKFPNVRECPCSPVKFPGVKRNREGQNEGSFLHTLTISVTSLFSPRSFSDATYRRFRHTPPPQIQPIPNTMLKKVFIVTSLQRPALRHVAQTCGYFSCILFFYVLCEWFLMHGRC